MPKQTADRVIDRPYSSAFRSGSGGVSVATSTSVPVHGLDSIYHTGTLDSRYYTEAELDAGQLDTRYYTETESDTRFVNAIGDTMTGTLTHQADVVMYSPGLGDIQFDMQGAELIATNWNISPAGVLTIPDVYHVGALNVTADAGDLSLSATGLTKKATLYGEGGIILQAYADITMNADSGGNAFITATKFVASAGAGNEKIRVTSSGVKIGAAADATAALDVTGGIKASTSIDAGLLTNTTNYLGVAKIGYFGITNAAAFGHYNADNTSYAFRQGASLSTYFNAGAGQYIYFRHGDVDTAALLPSGLRLVSGKYMQSQGYTSGWAGNGFNLDEDVIYTGESFLEVDNLSVRGTMKVYELEINQIRATNGTEIVSSAGKIASVTGGTWEFEDPNSTNLCAFADNDLVIIQDVDVNSTTVVKRIVRRITSVTGKSVTVTAATGGPVDVGTVVRGDTVVRFGNSTNVNRQSVVLITSDFAGSPYIDVVSGVTSWADWTGGTKTKMRMGHLVGITSTSNEYGLMAGNGFTSTDSWLKASTSAVTQNNISSTWTTGGTNFLEITPSAGLQVTVSSAVDTLMRSYGFVNSAGNDISSVSAYYNTGTSINEIDVGAYKSAMYNTVRITANSGSPYSGSVILDALGVGQATFIVDSKNSINASGGAVSARSLGRLMSDEFDIHAVNTQMGGDVTKKIWFGDSWVNRGGNNSEIANDTVSYKALMIAGNRSFDSTNRLINLYDKVFTNTIIEVGQARSTSNISKFTGRNTTISSISLTAIDSGYGAAVTFNAYHFNNAIAPTASGAFKFLGSQYTGNVTRAGMNLFDGNSGTFSWYISEAALANGANITTWTRYLDVATTGVKIVGNAGFNNTTPIAKPAAYTQTYATADKTIAARTNAALTNNTGGTVSTTLAAITAGATYAQADMTAVKNALASIADQLNKLRNDHLDTTQAVNAILDDLQAYGLLG